MAAPRRWRWRSVLGMMLSLTREHAGLREAV
jgi:hypothetical protein